MVCIKSNKMEIIEVSSLHSAWKVYKIFQNLLFDCCYLIVTSGIGTRDWSFSEETETEGFKSYVTYSVWLNDQIVKSGLEPTYSDQNLVISL